uniref:Ig-like domain-containing protein n=1 Tax=Hippocampus comes TaxID=109280 RepID=A0A3Q2YQA5_HIPCM
LLTAAPDFQCAGSSGQRVHQPEGDIHTVAGATVTLECRYETLGSNDYIFWYKQEANAAPEFILSRFKLDQGKTAEKYADRYRCSMDPNELRRHFKTLHPITLISRLSFFSENVPNIANNHSAS